MNLLYCFSCGYDVDHDGYNCPTNCQKHVHLPQVKRDEAYMYEGACMKAQHKTLPDGMVAGQVCCPLGCCAFHAACLSNTNLPFSICFVIIHPWPTPVPSGRVLCCAFIQAPLYMCASSRLTCGRCTFFWQLVGQLYLSWSTSYPHENQ